MEIDRGKDINERQKKEERDKRDERGEEEIKEPTDTMLHGAI